MKNTQLAPLRSWLTGPLPAEVDLSLRRLRAAEDVRHVAVMPDVHLAKDVCVGAVVATRNLVYPGAVGNDIGCGMAALAFDANATAVSNERAAANVMSSLYERVPLNKHRHKPNLPESLQGDVLSDSRLEKIALRVGCVQLGTLGRGNHFLEFQSDQTGRLWVMVHSGSRGMGHAIAESHLRRAPVAAGLRYLDAESSSGQAYLTDSAWARMYAHENRLAMLRSAVELLGDLFAISADWQSLIHCDHNHVQRETRAGESYWVHRKGAQLASAGEPGIIPGSMGAPSFHTAGRGCAEALMSCSHGAGRRMSRSEARHKIGGREFARQVGSLWYDHRRASRLRGEAPAAYKDIRQVMRAQTQLTKIVRELTPILSYKGA